MKEVLKERNRQFKENELQRLNNLKAQLINDFKVLKAEFNKLNLIDRFKNLAPNLIVLSMFYDDEIITLMEELNTGKGVTKYFVDAEAVFKSLDELSEQSDFLLLYEHIWECYTKHTQTFFNIQLAYELGFDLNTIGRKVKRQEKNGSLPDKFKNLHKDLKSVKEKITSENLNLKLDVFDESIIKSVNKDIKFSHKSDFYNLYHLLLDFNKNANPLGFNSSDFKCDFFDLVKILLRDPKLLKDDEDTQLGYGSEIGNRRFKIKRVDSLFLK